MPPDYLIALLQSIEGVVVDIYTEFPKLSGNEIESVYEQLLKYYKALASGKDMEEPTSPSERKQALMDEILNIIDAREELKADEQYINNPNILQGTHKIPSVHHLYVAAFKTILKSAKNWRKKDGRNGYVQFIKHFTGSQ